MRRFLLSSLLLVSVLTQVGFAQTQTSSQTVGRDPQAILVVQTALSAMGGPGVIGQMQNSTATGTSVSQAEGESETRSFVWTYAGNQFRNENDAATGTHILVSNSGNPQDYRDGTWVTSPVALSRANLPYHIPALVLFSEINNAGYSFAFLGTKTLNGVNAIHVQTRDDSDAIGTAYTSQDWYFNPATGLPVRVEFQIPTDQNSKDSLQASIDFSNFRVISGVLVPLQLDIAEGPATCTAAVSSVAFNANVDPNGFKSSTNGSAQ
jgi:hypothetical protein